MMSNPHCHAFYEFAVTEGSPRHPWLGVSSPISAAQTARCGVYLVARRPIADRLGGKALFEVRPWDLASAARKSARRRLGTVKCRRAPDDRAWRRRPIALASILTFARHSHRRIAHLGLPTMEGYGVRYRDRALAVTPLVLDLLNRRRLPPCCSSACTAIACALAARVAAITRSMMFYHHRTARGLSAVVVDTPGLECSEESSAWRRLCLATRADRWPKGA